MKKLITISLIAASAVGAMAQGSLNFGNNLGASVFRAPISGPVTGNSAQQISGQGTGALYFPTGSTAYTGTTFLSGTGYTLALYAGASSVTDENLLSLVYSTTFRTGGSAGFITTTTVPIPGVQPGTSAKFQIRVWDNAGGSITAFANAITRGESAMVLSGALGGTDSNNVVFPINPDSTGWTAFNIYTVPEPSTFVLAGLGAASLLIFRRRK